VNLIENAVKYNKPNGRVDISLKEENRKVILAVKDTGIGIPSEYQGRVFERFFRVDYGRNKKVGGTGLGLSIVKHIVTIYGGKISLQSKKDNGTTITIELHK
jgi:two-component system phosphate regulon sensor histidine kinase PhoR